MPQSAGYILKQLYTGLSTIWVLTISRSENRDPEELHQWFQGYSASGSALEWWSKRWFICQEPRTVRQYEKTRTNRVIATGSYSLGQASTARADSSVLKNMKEEVVVWRIVCYMLHV
jgi:hypothetical protein